MGRIEKKKRRDENYDKQIKSIQKKRGRVAIDVFNLNES